MALLTALWLFLKHWSGMGGMMLAGASCMVAVNMRPVYLDSMVGLLVGEQSWHCSSCHGGFGRKLQLLSLSA